MAQNAEREEKRDIAIATVQSAECRVQLKLRLTKRMSTPCQEEMSLWLCVCVWQSQLNLVFTYHILYDSTEAPLGSSSGICIYAQYGKCVCIYEFILSARRWTRVSVVAHSSASV